MMTDKKIKLFTGLFFVLGLTIGVGGSLFFYALQTNYVATSPDDIKTAEVTAEDSQEEVSEDIEIKKTEETEDKEERDIEVISHSGISSVSSALFLTSDAFNVVESELLALLDAGYRVGFVLYDVETGRSLSYNADDSFYCASSIKAAYCTMLAEEYGADAPFATIKDAITWSSNQSYETLTTRYSLSRFSEWLDGLGCTTIAENTKHTRYPNITPSELALVWQEILRFASSDEAGASEMAEYFSTTTYSAIAGVLRETYSVWNKAGWYAGSDSDATIDAGVVFSDCGAYIVVIATDIPSDMDALLPLVDALNCAHGAMCSGDAGSHLNDKTSSSFE